MRRYFPGRFLIIFLSLLIQAASAWTQESIEEDIELRELIYDYSYKGFINYNINLDTAEYYLLKALDLQYSSYAFLDDRVANNHITLASVYRRLYNDPEALIHLNKAEDILKNYDPNSLLFGGLYHNKGNIIKRSNDVYRTKEYYKYALNFMINNDYHDTKYFSQIFSSYLNLLFELGANDEAEELLSRTNVNSLNVSPSTEYRLYIINASLYSKLGRYDLANTSFRKASDLLHSDLREIISPHYIMYYLNVIDHYLRYEEYSRAMDLCQKALVYVETIDQNSTKNKLDYNSDILYRVSFIKYSTGQYSSALLSIEEGINKLKDFFGGRISTKEPPFMKYEYSTALPEYYILRSRVLFEIYRKSNSLEDLDNCFQSYHVAIRTLNGLKLAIQNEDSKFYATAEILDVYNEAVMVGKMMYEQTENLKFLEQAFKFTESSKSFALFSEIKDMEAIEFSDLPAKVRGEEQRLIGYIQGYEKMLYEEQLSDEPDSSKIAFYNEKLFHLNDDYNDLMQEIEKNNTKYFEFKYNPKFVSLQEVQDKLSHREALIEYVLNDTMLITYVIDNKGINVFSQDIGPEFNQDCFEYYRLLDSQNFSSDVHEYYKRFVELGREFYQILIEPCLKYTDKKTLTIVPDGVITYLPFEGFITQEADMEYINYMTLPYLIHDYSIGYSHSATMMFSERLKTKSPEKEVLAFAPKYKDPLSGDYDMSEFRQVLSDTEILLPLGGIIKEVQSINETVPSRVFLNEKATEANFKKHAPDYNVLHLAMHTIMKDDNPLNSLLAFTNVDNPEDTTEDNRLYAYEIYNMKLNAQMAVLSACSSGFGKMQKGEGMMSLARGFIYAGCPSIVMTLWQVSDKSSSQLMTDFYKYLKKGKNKQEAMRLAKIDYLETADELTSNPYFWSGFVVVGDNNPIYRKSGMAYYISLIALFIGILLFFQYKRR